MYTTSFVSKLFVLDIKLFNVSFQSQVLFKHRIGLVLEFSDLELRCLSGLGRYGLPLRAGGGGCVRVHNVFSLLRV